MAHALTARNLVVDYHSAGRQTFRALNDVSFHVGDGEIVGVVGESGSGKTTLGKVIAGFLSPASGMVETRVPTPASVQHGFGRRDVQMIFQESALALDPRMTARASIAEAISGGRPTGEAREQARIYLEQVGLGAAYLERKPKELSGGQRQRVAIARALATNPDVLVCDEAVASLDVAVRAKVLNLLLRIRQESGLGMVFISHDLSVISQLADRTLVMYRGDIVEEGPTSQVVHRPSDPYTKRLLAAIPRLERSVDSST